MNGYLGKISVFEFAIYRAAAQVMTEEERSHCSHLAQRADTGDAMAARELRRLAGEALARDRKRQRTAAAD